VFTDDAWTADAQKVILGTLIAVSVGVGLALVWWVFDSAPPGSRRALFEARGREWARRDLARPNRQGTRVWLVMTVVVIALLIWIAIQSR